MGAARAPFKGNLFLAGENTAALGYTMHMAESACELDLCGKPQACPSPSKPESYTTHTKPKAQNPENLVAQPAP